MQYLVNVKGSSALASNLVVLILVSSGIVLQCYVLSKYGEKSPQISVWERSSTSSRLSYYGY